MEFGGPVYILKQRKRIIIKIFVFAYFVCSKVDSVDKKNDLENFGPPPVNTSFLQRFAPMSARIVIWTAL